MTFGSGYALVHVGPDDNPDHGGGPIRRAPGSNVVRAHAGDIVHRAPYNVVNEAEAGSVYPGLEHMMFLPDGRLVPANASVTDMFSGAEGGGAASTIRTLVPAVAMFSGAALGFKLASKHQAWGAIGGAVAGGILGLIFR